MALTVVIGPPAAGKSTWVLERAKPTDVVVDYDRLAVALTGTGGDLHDHAAPVVAVTKAVRAAAIEAALKQIHVTDVYVIHSNPGAQRMAEYRGMGAQIVTVDPGRDVVRQRCKSERPRRMFAAIDEWYRSRAEVQQPGRASPGPAFDFPLPASRSW
jgi:hypothetical protein